MCNYDRLPRVPSTADLNDVRPEDNELWTKDHGATTQKLLACPYNGGAMSVTLVASALLTSCIVTLFSLYFPFWLAPQAAKKTYNLAFYQYNQDALHHFDTTAWTYGTDYGLATVMVYFSYKLYRQIQRQQPSTAPSRFCQHSWGLLLGYAASTTAGAVAHQYYATRQDRNTWHFRLLWTICVGTVTYASAPMGSIASEMARQFQPHMTTSTLLTRYVIPETFWKVFGIVTTAVCAFGWFSYQRPACDIFIAGITQFPSSFYVIAAIFQIGRDPAVAAFVTPTMQWMGMLAFIGNAPLLPLYPLLVQYTDWSLANVNTFLHTWLFVTWSMQAMTVINMEKAMADLQHRPPMAVPQKIKDA
ncbi:expressed unknown protein [Seminavis robusta]|uniref:Uncharacterized protein n=1 Tax=Seminavis robusta TaxID=568900 RepID=A0A9N8EXW8_9STRA|nr:expressed unknown protein [Seminavis robusta]|eukprot:Sro2118_g315320.1 n/a (360) ;mRNA; f:9767-10846